MKRGSQMRRLVYGGEYTTPAGKIKKIEPWMPLTQDAAVTQVMGMKIKELTGPYVYTFGVLGRAVGVNAGMSKKPEPNGEILPAQRNMRRAVRKAYAVMFPGQEAILDARKNLDTLEDLFRVGRMLQGTIKGEVFDTGAMKAFLDDDLMRVLETIIKSVGQGLDSCRRTAYGTVTAAGKGLDGSIADLIRRMLRKGLKPEEILPALHRDALGEEFCFLPQDEAGEPAAKFETLPLVVAIDTTITDFTQMLGSITVAGQPVLRDIKVSKSEVGVFTVSALFVVHWKPKGESCPAHRISFEIPRFDRSSEDGHGVITTSIGSPRFFRPRFSLKDGKLVKQGWKGYMMGALVGAISKLTVLKFAPNRDTTEHRIRRALGDAIQALCESDGQGDLVSRWEFEVVVPDIEDIIAKWEHANELLTLLSQAGFDVLSTSKGEPGTIVTKAGKLGIPDYMLDVNPFALFLDPKRRPETREIKDALPLAHPMPLAVRNAKGVHVFEGLTTELWVAWFDCNANVFTRRDGTRFAHDTILATAGVMEKLAIKSHRIPCRDEEEANHHVEELRERYGQDVTIKVLPHDEELVKGLIVQRFVVEVSGEMEDCGKIKALGTAIKAIPNVLPIKLHTVIQGKEIEIDIVVPRDTAFRKKDLSALFRAGAARLGMTEIDPETLDPKAFLNTLEDGFEQECGRRDGKVPIFATCEDGREELLGLAYAGPLAFFRPPQTNFQNFELRKGHHGISLHVHSMVMVGGSEFRTPDSVHEQFTQVVNALKQTDNELAALRFGGQSMPEEETTVYAGSPDIHELLNVQNVRRASGSVFGRVTTTRLTPKQIARNN